jgi:hypothetical protein
VGREDLASIERDDRDLLLVDDGQDPPAGEGRTDLEVVQATRPAQGDRPLLVGDVVAQPEVAPGTQARCGAVDSGRQGHVAGLADPVLTDPERSSPESTSGCSPDSPDRDVHLTPRPGSRDPRRHRFDAVVAAIVASCRAAVLSEQTIEFYLEGLNACRGFAGGTAGDLTLDGRGGPRGGPADRLARLVRQSAGLAISYD